MTESLRRAQRFLDDSSDEDDDDSEILSPAAPLQSLSGIDTQFDHEKVFQMKNSDTGEVFDIRTGLPWGQGIHMLSLNQFYTVRTHFNTN